MQHHSRARAKDRGSCPTGAMGPPLVGAAGLAWLGPLQVAGLGKTETLALRNVGDGQKMTAGYHCLMTCSCPEWVSDRGWRLFQASRFGRIATRPFFRHTVAIAVVSLLLPLAAAAAVQHSFTGAWAPTVANGFESAATGGGTFTVSVSADHLTLTAFIENPANLDFGSFFLQNYGYSQGPPILLPTGPVSYDHTIQYSSSLGFVSTFDDFGNNTFVVSGSSLAGSSSVNYAGGYFGYFGVNIRGDDGNGTHGVASATVTLSNFTAPAAVPEPASIALFALGLATVAAARRRSRQVAAGC